MMRNDQPSVDEARLRPHLRERERSESAWQRERRQAAILRAERDLAIAEGRDTTMPVQAGVAGGDWLRLRGIPVIGAGAGVSPGTQPEQETMRRVA